MRMAFGLMRFAAALAWALICAWQPAPTLANRPQADEQRSVAVAGPTTRPDIAKQLTEAELAYEMGHDALAAKREQLAIKLFGLGCEQGDPRSCYNVGILTEEEMRAATDPDWPRATSVSAIMSAYSTACELGFQRACAMQVPYLRSAEYGIQDTGEAIAMARSACEAGENFACAELAEMYYRGEGMVPDLPAAARLFRSLCEAQWKADHCFNYGLMLEQGHAQDSRGDLPIRYYRLGCRRGSDAACINLAINYTTTGLPENLQIAAGLFEQACVNGVRVACTNLASLTYDHRLVPDFEARAAELYRNACEAGDGTACRGLGNLALGGVREAGAPDDAIALFVKGCELGSGISCYNAGLMYFIGHHVRIDVKQSERWFARGCALESASACAGAALVTYSPGGATPGSGIGISRRWLELARSFDPSDPLVVSLDEWLYRGAPADQRPLPPLSPLSFPGHHKEDR